MNSQVLVVLVVLFILAAILGVESSVRLVRDLIEKGGWCAIAGLAIAIVAIWKLDSLLHSLIGFAERWRP